MSCSLCQKHSSLYRFYPSLNEYLKAEHFFRVSNELNGYSNDILNHVPDLLKRNGFSIIKKGSFPSQITGKYSHVVAELVKQFKNYFELINKELADKIDLEKYDRELCRWEKSSRKQAQFGSQYIFAQRV